MSDERERWPHQLYARQEVPRLIEAGVRRLALTSPTGGGKTSIATDLIEWAIAQNWYAVLYTNRDLLRKQLTRVLNEHGIDVGVRAAGATPQLDKRVQISMLPTEHSRVIRREQWSIHGAGMKVLAIVDEGHLNKGPVCQKIIGLHHDGGGAYVLLTATPIGLGGVCDHLVVAGKPSELRKYGAIVPAWHTGIDEPDMRNFKPNVKSGEFVDGDVVKAIMTKCVFSRVIENYRRLNADGRPCILFGPGVKESIWFAEEFCKAGIVAAHIDGDGAWVDGEYHRGIDRDQILTDTKPDGRIKVLCNRFVAREGLDMPWVSHIVAATVMGSLQSWLQSMGRGGRAYPHKSIYTIQDHGGHWWRHGSVNADREWNLNDTESSLATTHKEAFVNKTEPEPIRCPKCGLIRSSGPRCPKCGHEHTKSSRLVIQQNGRLVHHEGDIFHKRIVRMTPQTEKLWKQIYWRARKSGMKFTQARGLFYKEHGYFPPEDLPFMPTTASDWARSVGSVPAERLVHGKPTPATPGL